jgi:hypothetical protein
MAGRRRDTRSHGTVALVDDSFRQAELMRCRHRRVPPPRSSFAGFRFPREVIVLAVRWYLRYGLSYRDVEELLAAQVSGFGQQRTGNVR